MYKGFISWDNAIVALAVATLLLIVFLAIYVPISTFQLDVHHIANVQMSKFAQVKT